MLISTLLAILLALPITIVICLPIIKRIGNTHNALTILGVLAFIAVVFAVAAMTIRTLWTIAMSYYLPLEEFRVIATTSGRDKKIPLLSPLGQWISNKVLEWKIRREQ